MVSMFLRFVITVRRAAADERGSIQDWLPAGMAIVVAIVVLLTAMNYLNVNVGSWIGTIWQSIVGHL